MTKFSIVLILLTFSISTARNLHATEAPTLRLTMDEAVDLAISSNKPLLAAQEIVSILDNRRLRTGLRESPELSVSYSSDTFFNDEGESGANIAFKQRFPITNRLKLERELADSALQIAIAEIEDQKRLLIAEVCALIVEVAAADAQLQLRSKLIELDREFADFIASRIELGEASSVEANQVKIELYALEQERLELEHEQHEKLAELRLLLGLSSETKLGIDFQIEFSETMQAMPEFGVNERDRHPLYRMKRLLADMAEQRMSLATSSKWEDFAVSVFWKNERGVDEPSGIGQDQFLGLGVSIPLPNRKRGIYKMKEEVALQKQIELELDAIAFELKNSADFYRDKINELHEEAEYYHKEIIGLMDTNFDEMNKAYQLGQISLGDFFNAQKQQLRIESKNLDLLEEYEYVLVQWRSATAFDQLKIKYDIER